MSVSVSLVRQLIIREIEARYRGSVLGVFWSFLTPLLMLSVFTFVFGVIFQSRWGKGGGGTVEFALIIFAGMTTFSIFSDVVSRSPTLITSQQNLVKKVVFPLALLPIVALAGGLFQALIALSVLVFFQIIFSDFFIVTTVFVPIIILPLCIFTLGVSWVLSALGVYLRDIGQIIQPVVTALMFVSPIFYPSHDLPEWIRPFAATNPLAFSIEAVRGAVIFGHFPDPVQWLVALVVSLMVGGIGIFFFQKTRKGFADVL